MTSLWASQGFRRIKIKSEHGELEASWIWGDEKRGYAVYKLEIEGVSVGGSV